jgi:hypothetical protein
MSRPRIDSLEYDPHCRRCEVPLMAGNARKSRGRFVGICRPCEAQEGNARWRRAHPGAKAYTDGRRKYPVPVEAPK